MGDGFDGDGGVAELGAFELRECGPGGEDGGLGPSLRDEQDGTLMQDDEVAIGEVIFRGEGVRRIDPDAERGMRRR